MVGKKGKASKAASVKSGRVDGSTSAEQSQPAQQHPAVSEQNGKISLEQTPRSTSNAATLENQTDQRKHIGECMTYETLHCSSESFAHHYWPPPPKKNILDDLIEELVKEGILIHNKENDQYRFKNFSSSLDFRKKKYDRAKARGDPVPAVAPDEKTLFQPLGVIGGAICRILKKLKAKVNSSRMAMCPDTWLDSEVWGANFRIDGCTTFVDFKIGDNGELILAEGKRLHVTDILVPMEFKISRLDERSNRLQLTSAVNHIMNDDVRRMFVLGISIEDTWASLWYFSRSHSIMAEPLSIASEPLKFVECLAALFCASDAELGLDPHIDVLGEPGDKKYVYHLPASPTRPTPHFFKTEQIVDEYRSNRIAGRTTRVWKAIQVYSKTDTRPVPGAKYVILKDAWINEDADTEEEILGKVLKDIKTFVSGDWRSHPLLAHFMEEGLESLEGVIRNFPEYFSTIAQGHAGPPNKSLVDGAERVDRDFFLGPRGMAIVKASSTQRRGSVNPSGSRSLPGSVKSEASHDPAPYRVFASKRRCFYVYRYLCQRVSDLPTLGGVVDVLRQAHLALVLMFCAGWIHRDISHGNVLAFKKSNGDWQVKLSDLEYAKRFPPPEGSTPSSDPKTGTPFFMAIELQKNDSHWRPDPILNSLETPNQESESSSDSDSDSDDELKKEDDGSPEIPVVHNYQHDVESIFWMLLWFVTMRTKHRPSYDYGLQIFDGSLKPSLAREKCFTYKIPKDWRRTFHPSVKKLYKVLQEFRLNMYNNARRRGPNDVADLSKYSHACATPLRFFSRAQKYRRHWGDVELGDPSWIESSDKPALLASKPRRVHTNPDPTPAPMPTRHSIRLASQAHIHSIPEATEEAQ